MDTVTFYPPVYSGVTNTYETHEGLFAEAFYFYKENQTREMHFFKGVPPTEAEFLEFMPADRSSDLLTSGDLVPDNLAQRLYNPNEKLDSDWYGVLTNDVPMLGVANGLMEWMVLGLDDQWIMVPMVIDITETGPSPVIFMDRNVVLGETVNLTYLNISINPFKVGV